VLLRLGFYHVFVYLLLLDDLRFLDFIGCFLLCLVRSIGGRDRSHKTVIFLLIFTLISFVKVCKLIVNKPAASSPFSVVNHLPTRIRRRKENYISTEQLVLICNIVFVIVVHSLLV
jgi:hypothetical protein